VASAGFTAPRWHGIYTVLIRAVTATTTTGARTGG
jgi:hypothetical protein